MDKKKLLLLVFVICHFIFSIVMSFIELNKEQSEEPSIEKQEEIKVITKEELNLTKQDNKENTYTFEYKSQIFTAQYTPDNWKIIDSYKINSSEDIKVICSALIELHPVHGKDMTSYRTPTDMAYEWVQHNLMYHVLPTNSEWKNNAKDVDLDPKDQGKGIAEMYEDRTGKKFDINDLAL